MSQVVLVPSATIKASYERCDHAIVRGEFPALVFSGDVDVLGELPGELTAATMYKFAMVDERLNTERDFARTPHMPLPMWPSHRIEPTPGVCFVLADDDHPALGILRGSGGVETEHFVIARRIDATSLQQRLFNQLAAMVRSVDRKGTIVLLGFGDQGARISAILCALQIDPARIAVMDDNQQSVRRASQAGHSVIGNVNEVSAAAVIYTPLMRHERLYRVFELRERSLMAIDNSSSRSGASHFASRGRVWVEPAADRALEVRGMRLRMRSHGLPIQSALVVREDMRTLVGRRFRHLSSGHRAVFGSSEGEVDLALAGTADRLSADSFAGVDRAFVSLRDRPDAAIFAARSMCEDIWPDATHRVFPALCSSDLGATRFERIIKRHIDGAEVITASQTSAQQVALGVIANHYASDSPIVEIGSALGGSGALMAAATDAASSRFYSIDPETATRHIMRWAFQQQDQLDRLQQINATSDDAIMQLQELKGRAGLVFIDGLHTYAAAAADFANYAPLVREGGVLLIHDVEPARYSVLRVVIERVLTDVRFSPKCMVDGLLVLERLSGR